LDQFLSSRAAQAGRITAGQQMRVGVFAMLALAALIAVYLVLSHFVMRHNSYTIAVHFRNLAGLQEGSNVQLAGVTVGTVNELRLLPDQTVTAVCSIEPKTKIFRQSQFLVTSTLTGAATLSVTPPRDLSTATLIASGVPPEGQQPWGGVPPSFNDPTAESQPRIKERDRTLPVVDQQFPTLATSINVPAGPTDQRVTESDAKPRNLAEKCSYTTA